MKLETLQRGDHVSIRRLEAGDEAAFIRAVRASRKLHRPWSYLPETADGFRDMLLRPLGESYLICRNDDDALAGSASLGHVVFGNLRSAYLGYSAFVPHQGRGNMFEGLGFRREGYSPRYLKIGNRWRDHVRFAMLADEFTLAARRRR